MTPDTYFDSHLHLTDARFDADRGEALARARAAGVTEMVTIASNPDDARAAAELARAEPGVWATAGLHPHEASSFSDDVIAEIAELAARPDVVAIGETGLDFHYDNAPRDLQRESFRAQLALAERLALPIVVHSREADDDTRALVEEFGGRVTGVLHCFTAGASLLESGLAAGWYVSFSGIVTFGAGLEAAVRMVPDERLLVETDSPYLSPVPVRGRRNEPAHLPHTCAALAVVRGDRPERIARLTTANARRFYGLPGGERGRAADGEVT